MKLCIYINNYHLGDIINGIIIIVARNQQKPILGASHYIWRVLGCLVSGVATGYSYSNSPNDDWRVIFSHCWTHLKALIILPKHQKTMCLHMLLTFKIPKNSCVPTVATQRFNSSFTWTSSERLPMHAGKAIKDSVPSEAWNELPSHLLKQKSSVKHLAQYWRDSIYFN